MILTTCAQCKSCAVPIGKMVCDDCYHNQQRESKIMTTRAHRIKLLRASGSYGPALLFESPRGKSGSIPRDLTIPAEQQAEKLARATPGFKIFALTSVSDTWVYITDATQQLTKGSNANVETV